MPGLLLVTPPGPDADALCANLKDRGFDVHQAGNGAAAVDVAFRRQPDAILMDPSLSAMDRWHAVKRLNTEPSTSRIPVLTLVSDASSPGGLQRVLAKIERTLGSLPVQRGGQVRASDAELPSRNSNPPPIRTPQRPPSRTTRTPVTPAARPAPATPTPAAVVVPPPVSTTAATPIVPQREARPRQAQILVVDDNAMNRDMLSRRLERKGYAVEVAESGEQALEILSKRRFDLVLLDWMMPGLSGIDVLKKLREQYAAIQLPIIMATAKSEADDIVEALRAEANDYVTKPLNFDVVHARIRTQLNLVEAHRDLIASERRYRALLENTGDMIVQFRTTGQVLYVSPASRTLLGWEPDELKQRSFYDWMHPIDRRALEEQQRTQSTLPPAYSFLTRMQRQDQSWIWVETSCRLLREEGNLLVQAACRDVTEHMERLAGDEPPLPLGGDIMAHPGWRGATGTSKPPAPDRDPGYGPPGAGCARGDERPIVLTIVVGQAEVKPEDIGRQVAEQLASVWKGA
ncbi:MAG: response regulator [Myxococcales bacterium]|nr:response regulator [Myxococcales bacterium]